MLSVLAAVVLAPYASLPLQTPAPSPEDPMKRLSWLLGEWESKETTKIAEGKEATFSLKGSNTMILEGRTPFRSTRRSNSRAASSRIIS